MWGIQPNSMTVVSHFCFIVATANHSPARHFSRRARLAAMHPAALLNGFESMVLSLFKQAPQSSAKVSLNLGKHAHRASVLHARGAAGLTEQDERRIRNMPIDIRTIYDRFDLDPEGTVFAACTVRRMLQCWTRRLGRAGIRFAVRDRNLVTRADLYLSKPVSRTDSVSPRLFVHSSTATSMITSPQCSLNLG
jgi:hypothetical protein